MKRKSRIPRRLLFLVILVFVMAGIWSFFKPRAEHKMEASLELSRSLAPITRQKIPESVTVSSNSTALAEPKINRKTAQSRDSESLEEFLKRLDSQAQWRVNKTDTGRVVAISGALIQGHSDSPKAPEGLLEFARQIVERTGVPGEQLRLSTVVLEDTPETIARQFDQEIEGHRVFGGYMKIFTRKVDGAIYYIANETRHIGEVDFRVRYAGPEASQMALRAYQGKNEVAIESLAIKPVIYPDQALKQGELAWEVILLISRPLFDRRHLLISARSGQILKDVSLVVH